MGDTPTHRNETKASPATLKAEATAKHDVQTWLTNTEHSEANPEIAYHALMADYKDFKAKHGKNDVQQYVSDLQKQFKDAKYLPDLAVAMGYDKLADKSVSSRLSTAQLDALAKDKDPLTAMLGKELKADVDAIKSKNPFETKQVGGWPLVGWFSHNAPGLGRDDLNNYLDPKEQIRRAREFGENLTGKGGFFDAVAKSVGKDPEKAQLSSEDFSDYLQHNIKRMSPQETREIRRIIENWSKESLNILRVQDSDNTLLSKGSIKSGLELLNQNSSITD